MAGLKKREDIGHPIQIIDFIMNPNKPSKMSFNATNTKFILDSVGNRNVALISVAGPSRLGKSFLLNFMVRYLRALEKDEPSDWIGRENPTRPLEGFEYKNGIERMTTGMWLWSRPFIIKNDVGEEIAVLLMDTQGVFDDHTTMKEWSAIVGISLLTSSCLIYNVVNNLQEDALEILETFLQFGTLAMDESESSASCYQKLIFLIRDWNMPDECEYGPMGGQKFLNHKLKIQSHLPPSSKRVRESIKRCFEEINCFLMPEPGEEAKATEFTGSLEELDTKFVKNLITFMDSLLSPEQIAFKKIDGQPLKTKDLLAYFQRYVALFNSVETPSPANMLDATAYATCETLVSKCLSSARKEFDEIFEQNGFINSNDWETYFSNMKINAMKEYDGKRKFGDPKISALLRNRLEEELLKLLSEMKENNEDAINKRSDSEQEKLIEAFEIKLSNTFEKEFLMKEKFYEMIQQEVEEKVNSFCTIFGPYEEFLGRTIPILKQKLKTVTDQYCTRNNENIIKSTASANSLVDTALKKYQDEMDLRILQSGEESITEEILSKLHQTILEQTLSFYYALPKDGPQEFFAAFEVELQEKINRRFEGFLSDNAERRDRLQKKIDEFIGSIRELYCNEMTQTLKENEMDETLLELKHFQLQQKYFNLFMHRLAEIQQIQKSSNILHNMEIITFNLDEEFKKARNQLHELQEEMRRSLLRDLESFVHSHNSKILNKISEYCTDKEVKEEHSRIVQHSIENLNLPNFLTEQEKQVHRKSLLENLEKSFKSLLESFEKQKAEADSMTSDVVKLYQKNMSDNLHSMLTKKQLDECHLKEKTTFEQELLEKIPESSTNCQSYYKTLLEEKLKEAYVAIVDKFDSNVNQLTMKECISAYKQLMQKTAGEKTDPSVLPEWHQLYKEKCLSEFDCKSTNTAHNYSMLRKELVQRINQEFRHLLLGVTGNELNSESDEALIVEFSLNQRPFQRTFAELAEYSKNFSSKPVYGIGIHLEVSGATVSLFRNNGIENLTSTGNLSVSYKKEIVIRSATEIPDKASINISTFFNGNIDHTCRVNWNGLEKNFRLEESISMVLSKWKYLYQRSLGCVIKTCVIAVPSFFSQLEVKAIHDAATISAFEQVQIIRDISAAVLGLSFCPEPDTKYTPKRFALINAASDVWEAGYYDVSENWQVKKISGDNYAEFRMWPLNTISNRFQSIISDVLECLPDKNEVVDIILIGNETDSHSMSATIEQVSNLKRVKNVYYRDKSMIVNGCAFLAALLAGDANAKDRWQQFYSNTNKKCHWDTVHQLWDAPLKSNKPSKRQCNGTNIKPEDIPLLQKKLRQFVMSKEDATDEANSILLGITKKIEFADFARDAVMQLVQDTLQLLRRDTTQLKDIDNAIEAAQRSYNSYLTYK